MYGAAQDNRVYVVYVMYMAVVIQPLLCFTDGHRLVGWDDLASWHLCISLPRLQCLSYVR